MIFLFSFLGILFHSCTKDPPINNNSSVIETAMPDCDSIIIDDSLFNLIQQYDTFDFSEDTNTGVYLYKIDDINIYRQCAEFTISNWVAFVLKGEGFKLVWNDKIYIDETGNASVNLYLVHTIFPYTTWDYDGGYKNSFQNYNMDPVKEKMSGEHPYAKTVTLNIKTYWYHQDKKFTYKIK